MDCSLGENERKLYRVWLHSPSVFGSEVETILAFKIASELGAIPSKVLRVLRGVEGQPPELVQQLEAFVAREPGIAFVEEDGRRHIALAD